MYINYFISFCFVFKALVLKISEHRTERKQEDVNSGSGTSGASGTAASAPASGLQVKVKCLVYLVLRDLNFSVD